jgi:hypothetical protein
MLWYKTEVTEGWSKIHYEELQNVHYHSGDIIKENEIGKTCDTHGEIINAYKFKPEKLKGRHQSVDRRTILINFEEKKLKCRRKDNINEF